MNEIEQEMADKIAQAIQRFTTQTARGQQAREFRVGISDLGYCSERVNRMLQQQVPEDSDMFKAFLGTAIGDHVEQAVEAAQDLFPGVMRQTEVDIVLHGDQRDYTVPGHPDLVFPGQGLMLDAKSSDGLSLARRMGADQQKQFQRHGYGRGAWEAGFFGDIPLEDVLVGNVWIDRSGDESEVHVEIVPFDQQVLDDAARWLDEVVWAYTQGKVAEKEPAREVCAKTCGFFNECRQFDTDVSGFLTDPEVLAAIDMYFEGAELERQGKRMKEHAKPALKEVSGSTGRAMLRWVEIPESEIAATKRRAYTKIDLKPIKG